MEAAALFTVAALRGVEAACLLTVSDIVIEGAFTRITDDELQSRGRPDDQAGPGRRDRRLAFSRERTGRSSSSTRRARTARRRSAGPRCTARAQELGLDGDELLSERPGHLTELARSAAAEGRLLVVVGGDGTMNEVVNGVAGYRRRGRRPPERHRPGLRTDARDPDAASTMRCGSRVSGVAAAGRRRPRHLPRPRRCRGDAVLRQRRLGRHERRGRAPGQLDARRRSAAARPSTTRSCASSWPGRTPR